jgi:hypothetical protein
MELLWRMNTDRFDGFDDFVGEIEEGIKKYKDKINQARLLMFFYNISISYFVLENWKLSHAWLLKIIEQPKTDHRLDIQYFSRLFRLVLYYELNKHDLLEYELINVERYLRQNKAWFAYEATIIKFFKKLLACDESEKIALFGKFQAQLKELGQGKNSASLPGFSELQLWSQYHSQNKTVRELLLAENEQN